MSFASSFKVDNVLSFGGSLRSVGKGMGDKIRTCWRPVGSIFPKNVSAFMGIENDYTSKLNGTGFGFLLFQIWISTSNVRM